MSRLQRGHFEVQIPCPAELRRMHDGVEEHARQSLLARVGRDLARMLRPGQHYCVRLIEGREPGPNRWAPQRITIEAEVRDLEYEIFHLPRLEEPVPPDPIAWDVPATMHLTDSDRAALTRWIDDPDGREELRCLLDRYRD